MLIQPLPTTPMSVRRALAPRSIHLRIVPRPANLSESRELFRVLQRICAYVFAVLHPYYRVGWLTTDGQYEYQNPADNVALAIYSDQSSAQRALDASPIRFALENVTTHPGPSTNVPVIPAEDDADDAAVPTPQSAPNTGVEEILRPSKLLTRTVTTPRNVKPAPTPPPMPFEPPSARVQKKTTKWFQVTVDRSRAVHQDYIERQPYWKQFHPMKSMAQADLAKAVPHIGLSDVSKRPPNAHRTPNRVLRTLHDYVETMMPTLRQIVEGGERERQFVEKRAGRS
ncbi:Dimethylglycine oxidase [Pyrenophora seminiperda CCB06]|uniref:Dimethylglycine oxidase n=1 Tax=Pyrenophora seminiperda CCB06 TaxID=1302712 RepID=A0A3M7MGZ5_9PLEO|nr:Dimethylglycine oxidase [Pyrenophora seminiperda CCB06]